MRALHRSRIAAPGPITPSGRRACAAMLTVPFGPDTGWARPTALGASQIGACGLRRDGPYATGDRACAPDRGWRHGKPPCRPSRHDPRRSSTLGPCKLMSICATPHGCFLPCPATSAKGSSDADEPRCVGSYIAGSLKQDGVQRPGSKVTVPTATDRTASGSGRLRTRLCASDACAHYARRVNFEDCACASP